jgi:hypothetical protein
MGFVIQDSLNPGFRRLMDLDRSCSSICFCCFRVVALNLPVAYIDVHELSHICSDADLERHASLAALFVLERIADADRQEELRALHRSRKLGSVLPSSRL